MRSHNASRSGLGNIFDHTAFVEWHAGHWGSMPANLTTLAHLTVSSAMSLPKSAGDPGNTMPPRAARRDSILGSANAALISPLSRSTIAAGVSLGAPTPYQTLAS